MHPMKSSKSDLYYVYYATLALYQHQGPIGLVEALRLPPWIGATAAANDPLLF